MNLRRFALTSSAAVLAAAAVPQDAVPEAPDPNGGGWKLVHLDLVVTVVPDEQRLGCEGTARLRLDGVASSLGPTLAVNQGKSVMRFLDVHAEGAEIRTNEKLLFAPGSLFAHLRYPEPFARGAELEVSFLLESEERAGQLAVEPGIAYGSWVSAWYPVPLPARLAGFSSALLAAPGSTRFFLPAGWRALSNGHLVAEESSAEGTSVLWQLDEPVARSFVAGPFEVAVHRSGEREVRVYLLSPKPESASDQAETLARAIRAMEERFGPYPYSTFAIAEVPQGSATTWYASSEQGFIMAMSSAFDVRGGNVPLFAHEAAHAWWGNLVSSTGEGSLLCSETLAQYGAVLAIEGLEGEAAATEFLRFSRQGYNSDQCARGYFEMLRAGNDAPLAELSGGTRDHNLSDAKGHWVYHMLRWQIGDEVFFETLRGLIQSFASRSMSLDDVRDAFLAVEPQGAELERFFSDWLDRDGAPVLDVEWSAVEQGGAHEVELIVRQLGEPYRLRLEVIVDSAAGERSATIVVDGPECRTRLPAAAAPAGVRIDPHHRLLIWEPEYGERPGR